MQGVSLFSPDFCITTRSTSATLTNWPITWIPGCTPQLKFSVQMVDTDGVARIILAKDKTPSIPYFIINLGEWPGRVGKYILG